MSVAIQMKLVAVEEREFFVSDPPNPSASVIVRLVTLKLVGVGSPLRDISIQIPVRDVTDWPELVDVGQNYDLTITRG